MEVLKNFDLQLFAEYSLTCELTTSGSTTTMKYTLNGKTATYTSSGYSASGGSTTWTSSSENGNELGTLDKLLASVGSGNVILINSNMDLIHSSASEGATETGANNRRVLGGGTGGASLEIADGVTVNISKPLAFAGTATLTLGKNSKITESTSTEYWQPGAALVQVGSIKDHTGNAMSVNNTVTIDGSGSIVCSRSANENSGSASAVVVIGNAASATSALRRCIHKKMW